MDSMIMVPLFRIILRSLHVIKKHYGLAKGRQTDKDGRVNLWWTNQTLNKYLDGTRCFVEQYGNFTFPEFAGTEAYRV